MGLKRQLFCENKHYWHLSSKKLKRMEGLFDMIKQEHGVKEFTDYDGDNPGAGRYASQLNNNLKLKT